MATCNGCNEELLWSKDEFHHLNKDGDEKATPLVKAGNKTGDGNAVDCLKHGIQVEKHKCPKTKSRNGAGGSTGSSGGTTVRKSFDNMIDSNCVPYFKDLEKTYNEIIEFDDQMYALAVKQCIKHGAELRGDIVSKQKEHLIREVMHFWGTRQIASNTQHLAIIRETLARSAEIAKSNVYSLDMDFAGSSSHDLTTAQEQIVETNSAKMVEDRVKHLCSNFPIFSQAWTTNQRIELYLKYYYGIELPNLPLALETISREFRHQTPEKYKKRNEEERKKKQYNKTKQACKLVSLEQ